MNGDAGDIYAVSAAARKIRDVITDIKRRGFSTVSPFSVGRLEKRMTDFAKSNGITLGSKSLYMGPKSISHATRATKVRDGLAVSGLTLARFPSNRSKMSLFYDGKVFVYTDYKSKFIIHPNYEIKMKGGKTRKVNFITASKVRDPNEFNLPKYKKV